MGQKYLGIFLLLVTSATAQVQVKGYCRHDGVCVQSYSRRPPSPRNPSGSNITPSGIPATPPNPSKCSMVENHVVCGDHIATEAEMNLILAPNATYNAGAVVKRDENGRIKRSTEAKDRFKRERPCPANGNSSGSCPGYVIDHVIPLACGGADDPSNMQWQTIADGKAKDKWERSVCGGQ